MTGSSVQALVLIFFLFAPMVVACGGGGSPTYGSGGGDGSGGEDGGDGATSGATIQMVSDGYGNFSFSPEVDTVTVDQTVTWTNGTDAVHTVTADDGEWDSGDVAADGSYQRTFSSAGEVPYHCTYHGEAGGVGMAGTIVVEP